LFSSLSASGDEDGLLTRLRLPHPDTEQCVKRLREMADQSRRSRRIEVR